MFNATPFLKLYAKKRLKDLATMSPRHVQEKQLLSLLRTAAHTRIGKEYDFSSITSVQEYQSRVPLRTYEQFWNSYWRDSFPHFEGITWPGAIKYIPVSSGTTSGTTKWIPCSTEMLRSNTKAGLDLFTYHLAARPQSKVFGGRNFILGGSTDLVERAPGIYSGDLSGIAVRTLPWWAKARYFPPEAIALLKDWEQKIDLLAKESLHQDIRLLSGVPNWLIILCEKLRELHPHSEGLLKEYYPNLELLVHGGVNFEPYRERFERLIAGSHAELREVYPASEGFIAIADRGYGEGLRMMLDSGIFYEFVPFEELSSPNPTRHWIANVERDVNYAIVLTSCAGVWSYILGDTVRFVDTSPPRVLITGRTSYFMSAFGEHLIAEEVETAVAHSAKSVGVTVVDYAMGAIYPDQHSKLGGHLYFIEFAQERIDTSALTLFTTTLDSFLSARNEDYDAHRQGDVGMRAPQIIPVPQGTFAAWMKSRGKLGGQNKVPRLISNRDLFADLQKFVAHHGKTGA